MARSKNKSKKKQLKKQLNEQNKKAQKDNSPQVELDKNNQPIINKENSGSHVAVDVKDTIGVRELDNVSVPEISNETDKESVSDDKLNAEIDARLAEAEREVEKEGKQVGNVVKFTPKDEPTEAKKLTTDDFTKKIKPKITAKEATLKTLKEIDDDDEAVLALTDLESSEDDKVLEEYEDSGLVDQGKQAVMYQVENLYADKKKKKFRSKFDLRTHAPELVIKTSTGDETRVYLTKNFNDKLLLMLTDVKKAYVGIRKTEQHTANNPQGKQGTSKLVALLRQRAHDVMVGAIFLSAGLLYNSNFYLGSIVAGIIGGFLIFYKPKNKKE